MRVTTESDPRPADAEVVQEGLLAFNEAIIGPPNERPLAAFLRDDAGNVVGGLLGHTKWRWGYVSKLWVPAELRGRGYGSALLVAAETEAWSRGCLGMFLDTFEYQALPFYERHGYELFGTLEGFPPGYRQHYVRKLRPGAPVAR